MVWTSECHSRKSFRNSSLVPSVDHGLDLPIVALHEADEIHQLAAPHGIMKNVTARPQPIGADDPGKVGRKALHRNEPAPRDAVGEHRLAWAEQAFADPGVDAVGANDIGRRRGLTAVEGDRSLARVEANRHAAPVERNRIGPQRLDRVAQKAVQIAAVKHQMRRAEALDTLLAEIEPVPCFAGGPMAQLTAVGADLNLRKRMFEPQRIKNARAVRADLDAGTDLLELIGLLVDAHVDAAPKQRQRRGQTANAAADNDCALGRSHCDPTPA